MQEYIKWCGDSKFLEYFTILSLKKKSNLMTFWLEWCSYKLSYLLNMIVNDGNEHHVYEYCDPCFKRWYWLFWSPLF